MGLTKEELAILVTGKDVSATRTLRGVNREMNKTAAIAGKAGRNLGRNIERGIVVGVTAAAGAIGYAVKQAGDFEAQLNTINTIARADPLGLAAIGDQIRQIARDTGTPLEELTQGYYDLLSAGIKVADTQGVLLAANRLAIGGLATTAQTVDLLTTAINTYGGDASKAGAYADYFAKAVERGKVTADEIAASFATVGPIAASSGIEIQEVAAAYARLTAAGVPGAEAATQMRSAIVGLMKVTSPLAALQKQTGRNYFAIAGKKGLVYALQLLRKDADKAGVPLIKLLGRVEGVNFALQTTGPNFDDYNADLAAVGDSAGTAAEQMAERQKGLNYELGRLKANVLDAAITIGTELLPVFADLAGEGTAWLTGHQPEVKQFAKDLADNIRDAVAYAKSLDWDAIADALHSGADAAKTIVSVFQGMPPGVQQLLAGGYVANKLTGGAVTDLGGQALKIALTQFAGRGSSPANPLFVTGVGGGLGGGVASAGGGGVLGLLSKVFIVGFAAEAAQQFSPMITQAGVDLGNMIFPDGPPLAFLNQPVADFRRDMPWPIGMKDAPEWAGGKPAPTKNAPALDPRNLSEGNKEIVDAVEVAKDKNESRLIALASKSDQNKTATDSAKAGIVGAIKALDLSVTIRNNTTVNVKVPVALTVSQQAKRAHAMYQASANVKHNGGPVPEDELY